MPGDPDRLAATLKAAAEKVADLTGAHEAAAQVVLAKAVPDTPRRTGRLAASVRSDVHPAGFQIVAATPYAAIVHARRPWIAQAVDATTTDQVEVYTDHLTTIAATIES